ncbi:Methyltransferase-like protein 7B [Hypsizygus marmoreus]|uniref:Methyltransferase-like protein 7B n=1 Tax=Hypsizygus marmoreus TaxID=39966 RepID=A0A369JL28_HYPMA|nr:Methyltransferase-like protein 7B [Hypsizygus marmoreus]
MKLSNAFSILFDLRYSVQAAFMPTIREILHSPSLLLHPTALSRFFMSKVWIAFGDGVDENGRDVKKHLITPNAYGVVLDIGAGHGHTVNYLDQNRVTKYVALEPNTLMHSHIRSIANAAGFTEADSTLLILSCGAEDTTSILSSLSSPIHEPPVDTLISILTMCTIPSPQTTMTALVNDVLKPGGQLLFYEHVLSPKADVAWWQRVWTPVWKMAFDGCRLDRPSHLWVEEMQAGDGEESMWGKSEVWGKEGEEEENLFWHRAGRMVKWAV